MTCLALLEHLARVADLAGPAHVADVQQAVDALLDLDERAVVGEVADRRPRPCVPGGYFSATWSHGFAWACFMPRRDLLLVLVDVEDLDLDLVADRAPARSGG